MKDPVSDVLNRLKTSSRAGRESISFPYSKYYEAIMKVLEKEGYISSYEVKDKKSFKELEIELKYVNDAPKIKNVRRISKSSQRVYSSAGDIKPTRGGLGLKIVSTSKGVMTDRDARANNVGGEVVLEIY